MKTPNADYQRRNRRRDYGIVLGGLLGLFVFRVLGQLIQSIYPVDLLPPFSDWHSGALPYPVLLVIQLAIIGFYATIIFSIHSGKATPSPRIGKVYLTFSCIYFALMITRLVLGLTIASGHSWLDAPLPSVFHLVLAGFLVLVGLFHCGNAHRFVELSGYPLTMASALISHALLVEQGVALGVATLLPVVAGALVITLLEVRFPYRKNWAPDQNEIKNDIAFIVIVQNLLPKFLGLIAALLLTRYVQENPFNTAGLWPHHLPVALQMIWMMVVAEALRYWLHRLAHNWTPLWQFHAVHHSPHKLYWLNVGRFHPVEKAVQYLFDALPFIVLGVSENVLALYFVFYAINGFFQHCNIAVRLGCLNYLVSGPELHRWHHSTRIEQSNHNYGNNLIIWDLIFGTWYLPRSQQVHQLGLVNRSYPSSFIEQMATPFVKGLDKKEDYR